MFSKHIALTIWLSAVCAGVPAMAAAAEFRYFDTKDTEPPGKTVPVIAPWKVISLDAGYSGLWFAAGDLDGDGVVEIVTAKNCDHNDLHYTSAIAAQRMDGTVMWRWGDPAIGRKELHHDVACQIEDWDGDGHNEVIVATKGSLIELDGRTGDERVRIPLEEGATDSIVFCNLSGDPHRETVLAKDRYHTIWAYTRDGKQVWSVKDPGGYRTAHQPRPMDIDGDGLDEILAGFAMLNADGSVRWVIQSEATKSPLGHLDCARVMTLGHTPQETRIAVTFCSGKALAVIDGNGHVVWEIPGYHFESIQIGRMIPGVSTPQLLVDIDHQPAGASPLWIVGSDGEMLGQLITNRSRQHRPIEWDGDGVDEYVVGQNRGLYGPAGMRIGTFDVPGDTTVMHTGDMDGDGRNDVIFNTGDAVYIFRNVNGEKPSTPLPLGTGSNVTLY